VADPAHCRPAAPNAVLAEAPVQLPDVAGEHPVVLVVSARSQTALRTLANNHADRLSAPSTDLGLYAASLARRRDHHSHRLALVARDSIAAAARLREHAERCAADGVLTGRARPGQSNKLAFLLSALEVDLRVRLVEVHVRWDQPALHGQHRLDQAGGSRRPFEMADVDLIEPSSTGRPCARPVASASPIAAASMGSPTGVPVPWAST
jgi:hypothetical protein